MLSQNKPPFSTVKLDFNFLNNVITHYSMELRFLFIFKVEKKISSKSIAVVI